MSIENFGFLFAYDLFGHGKTVIRGGYGIFWNNPLTGTSSAKPINPPFLLAQSLTTTLVPTLRLRDGLPPPPALDVNRPASGATRSIFDPNFRDGYAQQWNLNVQQQFGQDYALEVSYVGSKGTHLVVKRDINQAPPVVGVSNSDVNRPFIKIAPALRALSDFDVKHTFTMSGTYELPFGRGKAFGGGVNTQFSRLSGE